MTSGNRHPTGGKPRGSRSTGSGDLPPDRRIAEDYYGGVVEVAENGGVCYVRVAGNGTLVNGAPLRHWLDDCRRSGATQFVVDLSGCFGMDSSFMGLLTGLILYMSETPGGMVLFVGIGDYPRKQLRDLGVLDYFTEGEIDFPPSLAWERLDPASSTSLDRARLAQYAHTELIKASPEKNRSRFTGFLTRLGRELFPFLRSGGGEEGPERS